MIHISVDEKYIDTKDPFFEYGIPYHILLKNFKKKQEYFTALTTVIYDQEDILIETSNSILIPRFEEIYPIFINVILGSLCASFPITLFLFNSYELIYKYKIDQRTVLYGGSSKILLKFKLRSPIYVEP